MKKLLLAFFSFLLVMSIAGVTNANLIMNGDFETLDNSLGLANGKQLNELNYGDWDVYEEIPYWLTYSGTGIEIQRSTIVNAHSSYNYVELDSEYSDINGETVSNSGMVQFVFLEEGFYDLTFWYRPRTNTPGDNGISVLFMSEDNEVFSIDAISSQMTDWTQFSVSIYAPYQEFWGIGFHATGTENELGGFLDDIELTAASVPEPAAMLLLGSGLFGLAVFRRKFKK